jgi:hypothetical protein
VARVPVRADAPGFERQRRVAHGAAFARREGEEGLLSKPDCARALETKAMLLGELTSRSKDFEFSAGVDANSADVLAVERVQLLEPWAMAARVSTWSARRAVMAFSRAAAIAGFPLRSPCAPEDDSSEECWAEHWLDQGRAAVAAAKDVRNAALLEEARSLRWSSSPWGV